MNSPPLFGQFDSLMRSLETSHATSFYAMPEVLNRASSVFLDSPVKPWNDKNEVLLINSLVQSKSINGGDSICPENEFSNPPLPPFLKGGEVAGHLNFHKILCALLDKRHYPLIFPLLYGSFEVLSPSLLSTSGLSASRSSHTRMYNQGYYGMPPEMFSCDVQET